MNIRLGELKDIPEVSGLWLEMVAELAPDFKPNVKWWIELATNTMESGVYSMFVAEEFGCIVGFIDYFIFPEPSDGKVHMVGQHLFVYPEYRGMKVSEGLYRAAIKRGKSQGAEVRELCCFDSEKEMWEKKGYKSLRSFVRRDMGGYHV